MSDSGEKEVTKEAASSPLKKRSKTEAEIDDKTEAETEAERLSYNPVHFIRSHSKNDNPADCKTQIWEVVFEPDPTDPAKTTNKVATCGGNFICITEVTSGTVLMKYKLQDEKFHTLTWSTITLGDEKTNILAAGGILGEIRLFHPEEKVCFYEWRSVYKTESAAINSLVFHSENPTWLFCGTSNGYVSLWDIGQPTLPSYDGVDPTQLLRLYPDYSGNTFGPGNVYNIAWTGASRWILAGTTAGLVGWNIEDDKVMGLKSGDYTPRLINFLMPKSEHDEDQKQIVDSLAVASEWTVVSKCVVHGLIYIWDLKKTVDAGAKDIQSAEPTRVVELDVGLLASLKWSDTENFFMNLGCHKGKGLICCGDDEGTIWLYNLPQYGKDGSDPVKGLIKPTTKLAWPALESSQEIPHQDEIIIDKVTTSHDMNFVVAVTNDNTICIWKRSSGD